MPLPLKVRYAMSTPIIIGIVGVSQLILAFVRNSSVRDASPQLTLGIIALVLSGILFVAFRKSVYLEVAEDSLTLSGVGGFWKKQYSYKSLNDLRLDGNKLAYRDGARWTTIPITRYAANREDWAALQALLSNRS